MGSGGVDKKVMFFSFFQLPGAWGMNYLASRIKAVSGSGKDFEKSQKDRLTRNGGRYKVGPRLNKRWVVNQS